MKQLDEFQLQKRQFELQAAEYDQKLLDSKQVCVCLLIAMLGCKLRVS